MLHLRRLQRLARALPRAPAVASRAASAAAAAAGPDAAAAARLRTLADSLRASVAAGVTELERAYGGAHAEKVWMGEYYRHGEHRFAVPALALVSRDARAAAVPAAATKAAVFFGALLRALPEETLKQYAAALAMAEGVDAALMFAAVRAADTPASRAIFERMGASVRRSGNRAVMALAQHVAAVPLAPPSDWPFPHLPPALPAGARAAAGVPPAGAPPRAHELAPASAAARDALTPAEYLLTSATTVLEALWAEFYATGARAPLRRVIALAASWAEFAATPDAVSYLVAIEKPLPAGLAFRSDDAAAAAAAAAGDDEPALRAVRATVARAAVWSLLHHSRRHARVTAAVAEACGALAWHVAEPAAREPRDADAPWADLDGDAARDMLEVVPALLHLISRAAIDAPHESSTS
jgi:hypothetical protein